VILILLMIPASSVDPKGRIRIMSKIRSKRGCSNPSHPRSHAFVTPCPQCFHARNVFA
jgi:hypothetical protein